MESTKTNLVNLLFIIIIIYYCSLHFKENNKKRFLEPFTQTPIKQVGTG